ncbi:hypothetical protein LguiA_023727 [Lonicera macranthoides]
MAYSSRGICGREFWLPSDIPMAKHHYTQQHPPLNKDLCFPTDFPYEFGSPVESSTESESDEDDLIAGLTRHLARSTIQVHKNISVAKQNLEKSWVLSGSPQSTLSAVGTWSSNGSPNGPSQAPSPPTTPYGANEDSWDLIYAAAGQVSILNKSGDWVPNCRGPTVPPRNLTPAYPSPVVKPQNTGAYLNQCLPHTLSQPNHSSVWGREAKEVWASQQQIYRQNRGSVVGLGGDNFGENGKSGRALRLSQSAWPPLKVELQQQQQRPNPPQQHGGSGIRGVFAGRSDSAGVKRECAGTGVFLPRRYENLTESRKKPVCSTPLLPNKVVQPQPQPQPHVTGGSIPDYNELLARRNALLAQQRRSMRPEGGLNNEIRLPQEWTY